MWAHSANVAGRWHHLSDHLRSTASLAQQFGAAFGAGELAWALGLFHDAGKANCEWQEKLMEVAESGKSVDIRHKGLGAALLSDRVGAVSMAILGHHGGLDCVDEITRELKRPLDKSASERFLDAVPEARVLLGSATPLVPSGWFDSELVAEMGIRLAFSALVDADHLDTAAHFAGLAKPAVRNPADMAELLRYFEQRRTELLRNRVASPVDGIRTDLYNRVISQALGNPGIYRLPAPTGSGKTIASAGFALHHCVAQQKSRIIIAVPFTTITEQNAMIYRRLVGEDNVLEHHSNMDIDARRLRLGAENWDAPFVVTTTVQLFDSLFGRKPARSRKLHRLTNAVIVLDEVQALPISLLTPILDALKILVKHFGTTVLLASATQPTFEHLPVWNSLNIHDLVSQPAFLFDQLKRVQYEWRLNPKPSSADIAQEISEEPQALAVVNTVLQARSLYRQVVMRRPDRAVFHLSTRMCSLHRAQVLNEVHQLLIDNQPVIVISTQLIEAGVDVDFPVVFRALAPAESLQQAAGRANREGRLAGKGRVIIFEAHDFSMPNFYRAGVDKTRSFFGPEKDPDNPQLLHDYYRGLYTALNVENGRRAQLIQENRKKLDYRSVADGPPITIFQKSLRDRSLAFRMIDEDQVAVAITDFDRSGRASDLLAQIRAPEGNNLRNVFRQLRSYTVSIPRSIASHPEVAALCRPIIADNDEFFEWVGNYDSKLGLDEGNIGEETVW